MGKGELSILLYIHSPYILYTAIYYLYSHFPANSELKSRSKSQFRKSDLSLLALEINRITFRPEVSFGLILADVLSLMVQITLRKKESVLCQDCLTQ